MQWSAIAVYRYFNLGGRWSLHVIGVSCSILLDCGECHDMARSSMEFRLKSWRNRFVCTNMMHLHQSFSMTLGLFCGYPVACSVLLGSWCFMFVTKVWKKCWEQSPLRCLDGTNLCRMRPWAGCNEVSWGVPRQEVKSTNLFIPNMMLSLPFYLGWWLSQLCV